MRLNHQKNRKIIHKNLTKFFNYKQTSVQQLILKQFTILMETILIDFLGKLRF
jgi:hypothetical protein